MKIDSKVVITLSILFGMCISDFVWYFRLKQNKFLEEMIFYLQKEDISIFYNMGTITLYLFIISTALVIIINRKTLFKAAKKTI